MRNAILAACAALLLSAPAAEALSLSLSIARIAVLAEGAEPALEASPAEDLKALMTEAKSVSGLRVELLPSGYPAPLSYLDAAALCRRENRALLLYGYLERKGNALRAEMKILDGESGRIAAYLYGADCVEGYGRLMEDLAAKTASFFKASYGLGEGPGLRSPIRGIVSLCLGAGFPVPLDDVFRSTAYGLCSGALGVRVVLSYPGFTRHYRGYWAFGAELGYALFTSQAGYESAYVHDSSFFLPVECAVEDGQGSACLFSLGPGLDLSAIVQSRRNSGEYAAFAAAPAAMASLGYRYLLPGGRTSCGLRAEGKFAFYETVMASFGVRFEFSAVLSRKGFKEENLHASH